MADQEDDDNLEPKQPKWPAVNLDVFGNKKEKAVAPEIIKKKVTHLEWLQPDYDKELAEGKSKEIANLAEELESAALGQMAKERAAQAQSAAQGQVQPQGQTQSPTQGQAQEHHPGQPQAQPQGQVQSQPQAQAQEHYPGQPPSQQQGQAQSPPRAQIPPPSQAQTAPQVSAQEQHQGQLHAHAEMPGYNPQQAPSRDQYQTPPQAPNQAPQQASPAPQAQFQASQQAQPAPYQAQFQAPQQAPPAPYQAQFQASQQTPPAPHQAQYQAQPQAPPHTTPQLRSSAQEQNAPVPAPYLDEPQKSGTPPQFSGQSLPQEAESAWAAPPGVEQAAPPAARASNIPDLPRYLEPEIFPEEPGSRESGSGQQTAPSQKQLPAVVNKAPGAEKKDKAAKRIDRVTKAELDKIKTPSSKAPIVTPNRSSAPAGNYSPNQSYDQETGTPSQNRSARRAAARMAKPPSKMEQLFQTPGSKVLALAAGSLFIGFSMALGFFAISQKSGPADKGEQALPGTQSQKEQTKQQLRTGTSGSGTDLDELSQAARDAMLKGDYKTAADNLNKLIALAPNSPQAQEKMALVSYCQADYKGALNKLNALISKHPKSIEALIDRAAVYYKQGNNKQAQKDYDMVLAIEPGNACALLGQSMCKLQRGNREDALRTLVRLVAQKPDFAQAYHPLAEIYLDQRDYALAVEMLNRAIKLTPSDDALMALRARAYFLSNDKENAVKDWEAALKLKPDNTDYKHDLDVARRQ